LITNIILAKIIVIILEQKNTHETNVNSEALVEP